MSGSPWGPRVRNPPAPPDATATPPEVPAGGRDGFTDTSDPYTPDPYAPPADSPDPYAPAQGSLDPYAAASHSPDPYAPSPGPPGPYGPTQSPPDPYGPTQDSLDRYAAARGPYAESFAPDTAAPGPGTAPRPRVSPMVLAAAVVGVVLLGVLATIAVRVVDQQDTADRTSAASAPPLDNDGAEPSGGTPEDRSAPDEPSPAGSSAALPASPPALIDYSAVAASEFGPAAALVIGDYLQAVNDGRYADAYRAYTRDWQAANPYDAWVAAERSSRHRDAVMTSVEQSLDGSVVANVSFVSTQAAGLGPRPRPQETCTQWGLVYRLLPQDGSYYPLAIDGSTLLTDPVPCA